MANTTVKGKFKVVAENGDVQTIYPKTTGDQVLVDRSSNASVIPNDVANLQHIVNKMGSLALKSKVETSDFTTGTMISSLAGLKSNTDTGKIADATVVKDIESRVDTLENSNFITVDEFDAGLATKPDTEINDSVTSTSLTWSSKKLSDQLTTLNSNTSLLTNRVNTLIELPDGATTNDARLEDIRNGYDGIKYDSPGDAVRGQIHSLSDALADIRTGVDGTVYDTAGSAVREQISNANHQIDKLNSLSENFLALGVVPWTIRKHGYFRYDTGEFYDVTRYETGYATLYGASGQRFLYRGRGIGNAASVLYYDSNDNYLGGEQYNENYYYEITVPTTIDNKNVNKVIFASCYDTSNTSCLTFEIYKFTNIIGKLYDRDSNLQSELNTEKAFTSNLSQQVNGLTTSVSDYDVAVKTMMGAVPYTNSKLNGYYKYDEDNNTVTFLNANRFASGYVTVDVNEGDIFLYRGRGVGNAVSVVFYNANDEIVETMQFDETKFHEITIPSGVKKAFFTSYRNKDTAKKLTFDLYTPGTIKTLIDNQPSVSSSMTLNTANRLYASMTLGQAKRINNLDRAVVCIGFDDYNLDCLEGVQYLNSQNLKSYLALIPDRVTDEWAMAHECYDNGGEIAAHSNTTLTSENQTFELMNEKFIQIPTIIGQHGFPVYGIIRAGGDNVGTENRSLDEFYCRAAGLKYSDYYGTVNPYRLTRENMTHKTLAEWQSYFDDLADRKGYAILYCHHLNGTEKNAYTNGFTLLDFKNLVSEIQNRDIDVMTINEFVDKYIYGITGTDAFIR